MREYLGNKFLVRWLLVPLVFQISLKKKLKLNFLCFLKTSLIGGENQEMTEKGGNERTCEESVPY